MICTQDNMPATAILLPMRWFTSCKQFTKHWTQEIALFGFFCWLYEGLQYYRSQYSSDRTELSKNRSNIVLLDTSLSYPQNPGSTYRFVPVILGPVVQKPISANLRLNFNSGFFFFYLKSFSRIIFSIHLRSSSHHIVDKKKDLN